jgi:hypothetical protein
MTMEQIISRADFDRLVAEHRQLIQLTNDLEFQLYQMGDAPRPEQAAECRQAAGTLIGNLRNFLFRYDQQILPILETRVRDGG